MNQEVELISIRKPNYIKDVPHVKWIEKEVDRMNVIEGLQYAVIGKFSYRLLELDDLRMQLPK